MQLHLFKAFTMLAGVTFSAALYSCKDDAPSVATPPLSAQAQVVFSRLTTHKWRMKYYSIYGNTSGSGSAWVRTDLYASMPACRRDDFLQFNTDYTLVKNESGSLCVATDPQSSATTWAVSETGGISISAIGVLGNGIPGIPPGGIQVTDSTLTLYVRNTNQGNGSETTVKYTPF
ncbi:MAG: hypothetical protein JWR44_398 [Hymenobacter sp.]|jgi:hypothetical protein|nr:hypothetical protein [Hymenobacter sp.]